MMPKTMLGLVAAAAVFAVSIAQAGRPLTVDDADPLDAKQFQLEAGAAYSKDVDCTHWDFPGGLTYGLIPDLEVGVGLGGQLEERTEFSEEDGSEHTQHENGLCDLVIGAKWQFLGESAWCPRQALAPSVKFPTADRDKGLGSGKTDCDLTWIASKSLSEKVGAHINVGYTWVGEPAGEDLGDVAHYGLALDYKIMAPLQWVGEVFADKELKSGTDTVMQFNTGFRWDPIENLTLDIAAGSRICGDAPDFTATTGLTWVFDFLVKDNK